MRKFMVLLPDQFRHIKALDTMRKGFSILLVILLYLSQTAFSFKQPLAAKSEIEKAAEAIHKKQILAEAAWAMGNSSRLP